MNNKVELIQGHIIEKYDLRKFGEDPMLESLCPADCSLDPAQNSYCDQYAFLRVVVEISPKPLFSRTISDAVHTQFAAVNFRL